MGRWSSGALAPLLCCLVLLSQPAPVAAQLELGPSIGLFWPLGGWTQDFNGDQVERRNIAVGMLGARLAYWTSNRLGFEATFGYAPSQVAVSDINGTEDITASVVLGSARVLARLLTLTDGDPRDPTRWDFIGGVGAGIMARRGSAWANTTGTTHPAVVLSVEARTHFAGVLNVRAGLEDFVSAPQFNKGLPAETFPRVQHDVLVTVALQIPLGGATR